jgi:hypothetical protein
MKSQSPVQDQAPLQQYIFSLFEIVFARATLLPVWLASRLAPIHFGGSQMDTATVTSRSVFFKHTIEKVLLLSGRNRNSPAHSRLLQRKSPSVQRSMFPTARILGREPGLRP